jgi:hypothetical protein
VKAGSAGVLVIPGHPIDGTKATLVRRHKLTGAALIRLSEPRGFFRAGEVMWVEASEWKRNPKQKKGRKS